MGFFKAFSADVQPKKVRVTKIGNVDGSEPKVPIGQVVEGTFAGEIKVGFSLNLSIAKIIEGDVNFKRNMKGVTYTTWCTSIIQKILSDNTFQTKNSIYKLEIIS